MDTALTLYCGRGTAHEAIHQRAVNVFGSAC
jgi:hypothetical protein